jgi:hypothetical protein
MIWVFLGYASVACAALVVAAAVTLPADANADLILHLTMPFACMILLGAEAFVYGSPMDRSRLKAAFVQGRIWRSSAYLAGAVAGAVVLVLHAGLLQTHAFGFRASIAGLITSLFSLVLAPVAASVWLVTRAKRALRDGPGFPVIQERTDSPPPG